MAHRSTTRRNIIVESCAAHHWRAMSGDMPATKLSRVAREAMARHGSGRARQPRSQQQKHRGGTWLLFARVYVSSEK